MIVWDYRGRLGTKISIIRSCRIVSNRRIIITIAENVKLTYANGRYEISSNAVYSKLCGFVKLTCNYPYRSRAYNPAVVLVIFHRFKTVNRTIKYITCNLSPRIVLRVRTPKCRGKIVWGGRGCTHITKLSKSCLYND